MKHIRQHVENLRNRALKKGHICIPLKALREKINFAKADREPFNQITEFPELLLNLKHHRIAHDEFTQRRYLIQHERADWSGVNPDITQFTHRLMWRLRKNGFPTYVHTALRTPEEQERLFLLGYSAIRKNGAHGRGAAVDIVHCDFHWNAHKDFWSYIGNTGKDIARQYDLPIEWGGDFVSRYDPAHWQLKDWRKKPVLNHAEKRTRCPYSETMRYA